MRLINATTLQLEEFVDSQSRPGYAILSHRWTLGQEVSFQDFSAERGRSKSGFAKIKFCCEEALKDGLLYAWVDTCCIDKESSSELSEAINSMYGWYADAHTCYAYLNDVAVESSANLAEYIAASTWFTRAWTLQEFLAPKRVIFFDTKSTRLASKTDIARELQVHTSIPEDVLLHPHDITSYTVAVRMSWAAGREATRAEDRAYSLFGIFQVNLPLLYGEGDRSFARLQEEIIKQTYDHSTFAWTPKESDFFHINAVSAVPLLAPTPDSFRNLHDICNFEADDGIRAYSMTNIGLQAVLQLAPYCLNVYAARLNFGDSPTVRFGLLLARQNPRSTRFFRVSLNGRSLVQIPDSAQLRWMSVYISRSPMSDYPGRSIAHHQAASLLTMQQYSIRVRAPDLLGRAEDERRCIVVAYHEWEKFREAGEAACLSSGTMIKEAKQSDVHGSEIRNRGRDDEHIPIIAVADDAGDSSTEPTFKMRSYPEAYQAGTGSKMANDSKLPKFQPFGTLRMPAFRTGIAGGIVFGNIDNDINCGVKCIKIGFDFEFKPVVILGTDEDDAGEARYGIWPNDIDPEYGAVDFNPTRPSLGTSSTQNEDHVRKFWGLEPDSLGNNAGLIVTPEGAIALGDGIYAFCLPDATCDGERWIFKQNETQSWYLSIELRREGHEQAQSWVLDLQRHDEQVQIVVHHV